MKAAVVQELKGAGAVRIVERDAPSVAAGQELVRVRAVGLNFADTMQAVGAYPGGPSAPYVLGLEFAGETRNGRRVMGFSPAACAEEIAVPSQMLIDIPPNFSFEQAAAFPVNYLTAYFAFWMAGLIPDSEGALDLPEKSVLIHAVAGGVGTAAVQIAALLGITSYGTASSDEKLAKAQQLGLTHAINYSRDDYEKVIQEQTGKRGVSAVFEMLGGEHTAKSTRCLAHLGRMIIYGSATGKPHQFDFISMFSRNASAQTLWITPLVSDQRRIGAGLQQLLQWAHTGKLIPQVGHTLPLDRVREGFDLLSSRKSYGKVIITM